MGAISEYELGFMKEERVRVKMILWLCWCRQGSLWKNFA